MFEEMVIGKTANFINTYFAVLPNVALDITPTKAINKSNKIRRRKQLSKIKISQSET